ncbi:MAG: hypothetical protein HYU66_15145 [Armatimonadetes bacterium]|nr:hypothetical protein [Armatimonadota bacterium]
MKWWQGAGLVLMLAALSTAASACGCCAEKSGEQAAQAAALASLDAGALRERVSELRWELHELGYTDTASPVDIAAKRAEYELAQRQLQVSRGSILKGLAKLPATRLALASGATSKTVF